MLRELLSLFRSDDVIAEMGENFSRMLDMAKELTFESGGYFFEGPPTPEQRTSVSKQDIKLNKMERRIRKQVIVHLALGEGQRDTPYGLLLMSLVKDVERIGDYCKNLAEVYDDGGGPIPDDENAAELREIRAVVEDILSATGRVFGTSDTETSLDLIRRGREVNRRCDALVKRVAGSDYDAATTTTMVLGARYYKRIQSHLLNVLSGVVMPLHKLDYYDERALPDGVEGDA
ncbi:MAG: PhoU domain-containing protein [Gemmatimonadota bacterium]|jgi:phosphate uptake regulator